MAATGSHVQARIRLKERDNPTWKKDGVCTQRSAALTVDDKRDYLNMFFPGRDSSPGDVTEVKKICASCPVSDQCLAHSIVNWEKLGIWGGRTGQERAVIRRTMRLDLGRPKLTVDMALSWLADRGR